MQHKGNWPRPLVAMIVMAQFVFAILVVGHSVIISTKLFYDQIFKVGRKMKEELRFRVLLQIFE